MGALRPRYAFVPNPRADDRFTRCPRCEAKTRVRKLPLVIHVEEAGLLILGKTCRLCVACEVLIAHRAEVEQLIGASLGGAVAVSPKYSVLATVDTRVWRRGLAGGVSLDDVVQHMSDFKAYLRVDSAPAGWYPKEDALANNALQPPAGASRVERLPRRPRVNAKS
jgi:hypothetical protein